MNTKDCKLKAVFPLESEGTAPTSCPSRLMQQPWCGGSVVSLSFSLKSISIYSDENEKKKKRLMLGPSSPLLKQPWSGETAKLDADSQVQ